ncbi:MAG: recombination protein RecR [candidate division NC10 bacterium]|nr:recombination protein RecR [candidate division NC10 bacterium]
MPHYAPSLSRLIEELQRLPGIGPKTAQRLAFYLLKVPREEASVLAYTILEMKDRIRVCSICFNIGEEDKCKICRDGTRDETLLCVVEEPNDLLAIERTREYKGYYHVLQGSLSPLEGRGPEDIRARELINRLKDGQVREVIIATNPNVEGEATAFYLGKLLKPIGVRITRIAMGLPMGGDLEYADEVTLSRALEGRREF